MQRVVAPPHRAEAPLDFALYRYSDEALSALLGATRDLETFIHQEMATRSRRLLQETNDSLDWTAARSMIQTDITARARRRVTLTEFTIEE